MFQTTSTILGVLGGAAALFYALGFTVVKTYLHETGLEGMFWLTKEFYTDAGGTFLLEMVRAPLLTPHLFLAYLIILYFLIPKEENLLILKSTRKDDLSEKDRVFRRKQWIKLSILILLMIGTSIFATNYDSLKGNKSFVGIVNRVIYDPAVEKFSQGKHTLIFFSLATPVVIAVAYFFYRFRGLLKQGSRSRCFYQLAVMVYAVFLAIIPVSYGFYLYDWKVVSLRDTRIIEETLAQGKDGASAHSVVPFFQIWLLGEFDDKYLFVTKENIYDEGIIQVIDKDQINQLSFDPSSDSFLRNVMPRPKARDEGFRRLMDEQEDVLKFLKIKTPTAKVRVRG